MFHLVTFMYYSEAREVETARIESKGVVLEKLNTWRAENPNAKIIGCVFGNSRQRGYRVEFLIESLK